jgi:hypothetical protein
MNPNEFGKRLGIGVRVAGRIAQQRASQAGQSGQSATPSQAGPSASPGTPSSSSQSTSQPAGRVTIEAPRPAAKVSAYGAQACNFSRVAGRSMGGFLRPFGRVGGILWLEVTGFFFGLFALYFAQDLWRTHASYLAGPQHQRFLIAAAMTALFGYLSVSAFWRARQK